MSGIGTGGVYPGGGIPVEIQAGLKGPTFMKAFTNKGRFGDLPANVPVRVILNEKASLPGAAHRALETVLGIVF